MIKVTRDFQQWHEIDKFIELLQCVRFMPGAEFKSLSIQTEFGVIESIDLMHFPDKLLITMTHGKPSANPNRTTLDCEHVWRNSQNDLVKFCTKCGIYSEI